MQEATTTPTLDLNQRLRRSQGRSGRTFSANVKLTRSELATLEAKAQAEQKALGEWAREVLLHEARSTGTDALFSEVVALRMMLNELLRSVCCGQIITAEAFDAHLFNIRQTKQQVAQDIRQQYAAASGKEQ